MWDPDKKAKKKKKKSIDADSCGARDIEHPQNVYRYFILFLNIIMTLDLSLQKSWSSTNIIFNNKYVKFFLLFNFIKIYISLIFYKYKK